MAGHHLILQPEKEMAAMETGGAVIMAACHVSGLRWGVSCGRGREGNADCVGLRAAVAAW
jgi:hypothetical protein